MDFEREIKDKTTCDFDERWLQSMKDVCDDKGRTLLYAAVQSRNLMLTRDLLTMGYDVDTISTRCTPLHAAVAGNSIEIAKCLIEHGADINKRTTVSYCEKTPLLIALFYK